MRGPRPQVPSRGILAKGESDETPEHLNRRERKHLDAKKPPE